MRGGLVTSGAQRILHDTAGGGLFHDSDGCLARDRAQFADLSPGLSLDNSDFVVA